MKSEASFNLLSVWAITVVDNTYSRLGRVLTLMAVLTQAKKFKSVIQQFKVFCLRLRQFDVFYWAGIQNKSFATVNTSQMVMIPIYRAIECFACWEVATTNQSLLLKSAKMSINSSQSHIRRAIYQTTMQLLSTDLIRTIIQLFQNLLLTVCQFSDLFEHSLAFESQAFPNLSLLVP